MDTMHPSTQATSDDHLDASGSNRSHPHTTTVTVNNRPVVVPAPKATGFQIKEAAKAAGLPVETDFVLSEDRPNGDELIVGDNDEVTVKPTSRFTAIAPDDNS